MQVTTDTSPMPKIHVPPPTAEGVARAHAETRAERIALGVCPICGVPPKLHGEPPCLDDPREPPHPPTEEEWERCAATQGLANLIQQYGAKRVMRWVTNLAAILGQEV